MDFFSEPDHTKCLDCETTDTTDRTILWTTKDGKHEWICPECATRRRGVRIQREREENDKVNYALDMW